MDSKTRDLIIRLSLENAAKYGGKANQGAVVGMLIAHDKAYAGRMQEIGKEMAAIVREVNGWDTAKQSEELALLNPDFADQQEAKKKERKEKRHELPELDGAQQGKVVTRMAPEPSKYAHIGHALAFLINYMYARKYEGRCILRFDDTNPEKETQEYVDAMRDDVIEFLGIKADKTVFASDHMDEMISIADSWIHDGIAYVCSCERESISKGRRDMVACACRSQSVDENIAGWEGMRKKGEASPHVLRLKIDMKHKNAVMRDPVIFRTCDATHYRKKTAYKAWPMYDLETVFMEGKHGVTHVVRSNEFDSRIELHHHLAGLMGYAHVHYRHYGRFQIPGATTQGREVREGIQRGDYIGWDDPRLVTLRALRRRGIVPETFFRLARVCGLSKTQNNLDFTMIASINRQVLDETAKRFFFISDPVKVRIEGVPSTNMELDMHPDQDLGKRAITLGEDLFLERHDVDAIVADVPTRLIDTLTFIRDKDTYRFISHAYDDFKKGRGKLNIHYVPAHGALDVQVRMPDGTTISGKGEPALSSLEIGEVVQFQRFGFCRLDEKAANGALAFWFTHD